MKFSLPFVPKSAALGAVGLAGLLMAGCATNGPLNVSPAVSSVPAGSERLFFAAPGLPKKETRRAEYADNYQDEEYVLYSGAGGAQAEAIMVEASPYRGGPRGGDNHVLEFDRTTRDTMQMWNLAHKAGANYGESFAYKSKLPYYLLPFTRSDTKQSCVAFHAEFNLDVWDERGGYDNQLFGYYCAPKGVTLTRETMQQAVDGLDVTGITSKAGPLVTERPFQQLKNDTQLATAIKRGEPDPDTGMEAFPLDIVRIYSDRLGGNGDRD